MKLNRGESSNEIRLFYNQKLLFSEILHEWGNADIVVQTYITPKTKQASLLRYEVNENGKIKAFIILNDQTISNFPFLDK